MKQGGERGEGQSVETLSDACEINPQKPALKSFPDKTPILFVPMAAVDEITGTVAAAEEKRLGEVRQKSYKTFAPGDVLFAKITPCMENGKSAVVPEFPSGIGFGSTEFHVLRPKDGLDPRYLWHFVRQERFKSAAKNRMTGTVGQARVPAAYLESVPFSAPSPPVQAKVVELLDTTVRAGRDAVDHLAQARAAITRLRAAVYTAACSGDLTADWREAHGSGRVEEGPELSPQASRYASGAPNTDELVEIPSSWSWWAIESATDEVIDYRGRTPPSTRTGTIPHIRTSQIRDGRIDWDNVDRFVTREVYAKYMTRGIPKRGDVLFTMEAPMGEVAVVDRKAKFSLAQRILLLRPASHLTGDFLALALQSSAVRQAIENRATGSGVRGVAYKRLRSVLIPIPPVDEQEEIVRIAGQLVTAARALSQRVHAANRSLAAASQAVASKAFSGA